MKKATARRSVAATMCALCVVVGVGGGACTPEKSTSTARRRRRSRSGASPTTSTRRRWPISSPATRCPTSSSFPTRRCWGSSTCPARRPAAWCAWSSTRRRRRDRQGGRRRSDDADRLRRRRQSEAACARPYPVDFGKRAYRRPLTDAEKTTLTGAAGARRSRCRTRTALAWSIEGMLLSPKFLFRPEIRPDRSRRGAGRPADVVGDRDAALVLHTAARSRTPS